MTNIITFSTSDREALNDFPPLPAGKMIPDWFKDVPVDLPKIGEYTQPDTPSIKRCMPVLDYLTTGYIIRASYEIHIKELMDNNFMHGFDSRCRDHHTVVSKHPWHQAPFTINGKKSHYLKITQPWHVKTAPGYSCMYFDPYYHLRKEFSLFPGIIDTDGHNEPAGLVGLIKEKEFIIKPGDPLIVVFPFKREDWQLHTEFRDNEYEKSSFKYRIASYWSGFYQRLFHVKKNFK